MTALGLHAVTANLACGGVGASANVAGAHEWVDAVKREAVDLLFIQEAPLDLHEDLSDAFDVHRYAGPDPYKCRSLVAVRRDAGLSPRPFTLPNARYHRSYLAAVELDMLGLRSLVAVSVHASPSPFERRYEADWDMPLLPAARPVGRTPRLWDADLVLETLRRLARLRPVLAAGDFNEARASDTSFGGPWGALFFERALAVPLVDVTFTAWGKEHPTRAGYQIDHVLASPSVAAAIAAPEVIRHGVLAPAASDHQAVQWCLSMGDGTTASVQP